MDADAKQLVEHGHRLIAENKYAEAMPVFEQASKLLSDVCKKAIAIANVGVCYAKLGNYDEAKIYFNAAIKCDPLCARAFFNRGVLYDQVGNQEAALHDYTRAIKADPRCADAYANKGVCLKDAGQISDAAVCFLKAVELEPDEPKFQKNAGIICLMDGSPVKALQYFVREIRLRKKDKRLKEIDKAAACAFVNAAQCYRAKADFRRAISAVEWALEIDNRHAGAYEELGNNSFFLKKFTQAVIDYTKALVLSKNPVLVEKIEGAALESKLFKNLAKDCSMAEEGVLSIDELIVKLDRAICDARMKFKINGQ
ncbi:tetratricopeptide repeat protein [Candidatus Woesearchaeota archaeon]|nr:tetratricopeptide repeat protein [Candidatus Woesearchaeota archaeon]